MGEALDIARTAVRSMIDGDRDALAALLSENAEWHNSPDFPGASVLRGRPAIVTFVADFFDDWSHRAFEIERSAERGDLVVLGLRSRGSGRTSGVPIDVRWALTLRTRDGLVTLVHARGEFEKAVKAAGL